MSCRLIRNKNNEVIGAAAPNGKNSILFNKLVEATGNLNEAENLYNELASKEFKAWFGIDWEKDLQINIETVTRYTNTEVKNNPDKIYIFGDNNLRRGKGGQAIIRDHENAFGISTKKHPGRNENDYFNDRQLKRNKKIIDFDISKIKKDGRPIVFPKDGIGTGLAKLKEKAPETYAYLKQRLLNEFGFNNDTGKITGSPALSLFTDENGEPKLVSEIGFFSVKNKKGETFPILAEIKDKDAGLGLGRELQDELINTIVGFINDIRVKHPNIFSNPKLVNKYFNLDKESGRKGILAEKILLEAFNGLEHDNPADVETAKELYTILTTQGRDAFVEALPEDVSMNYIAGTPNNASQLFILAYHNWNSIENPITGNIEKVGVRELVKDSLVRYGMKLKDDIGEMEEFDEDFVRIYGMSRLSENPQQKLSQEAKAILGNITIGTNSIGYPRIMPTDSAYGLMAEATVNEPNWEDMKSKLVHRAKFKPEIRAILNTINKLPAKDEAVLFSNFRMAYKNFILFKSEKLTIRPRKVRYGDEIVTLPEETFYINKIINSNQSLVAKKSKAKFRENAREILGGVPKPRAIYIIEPDGKISVKPEKLKKLEVIWNKVKTTAAKKSVDPLTRDDIDSLGEYLWELGVEFGPSLEATQDNLERYFTLGDEQGVTGIELFHKFVSEPGNNFNKFINELKKDNPKDIYREYSSLMDKISELSLLFETRPFGSFISGTNKQYYPINLPTRLDDLVNLINNPKNGNELAEFFDTLLKDPMYMPGGSIRYASPLIMVLSNSVKAQENFTVEILDSYKASNELVATTDYENQSSKISLIERFLAFHNRGNKNFTKIAIPIQADRRNLSFLNIPRTSSYKKYGVTADHSQIIRGFILQDLASIEQATNQVLEAQEANDSSNLIKGYHFKDSSNPFAMDGSVFTMTQIRGLENTEVKDGLNMSYYVDKYIQQDANFLDSTESDIFKNLLSQKVTEVENKLTEYENNLVKTTKAYEIDFTRDVNSDLKSAESQREFIKDFVFENFVGKIEIMKLLRGGFRFAKDEADIYKRMGLINTPGTVPFMKGMSENDPNYGMSPTYNALTIEDFDLSDITRGNQIADTQYQNLINAGVNEIVAKEISDQYRPGQGIKKTDAQTFISLRMYKDIMQGLGQWDNVLDQQAYNNAISPNFLPSGKLNLENDYAGLFVDNQGRPRPIYPLKPYAEELTSRDNINAMHMDKNSYVIVTPELADNFPYLQSMLDAMIGDAAIDVIHTESATKGARKNVQDFLNNEVLDVSNVVVMNSKGLRFPQIIPKTKKGEVTFNKQLRKNLITNIVPDGDYKLGETTIKGIKLQQLYGEVIASKIAKDTSNLEGKELGLTQVRKSTPGTIEYKDAKLNFLKNLRDRISKQVKDKDLPDNYLDALNIVPNGSFDWKFKIPLAFPNYQAKFEGIILSMYHNDIFVQKLPGEEFIQIAELGGHDISGELRMYNGSNLAEVRIKASALGLPADAKIEDYKDDPRLEFIGYRMPHTGKNLSLVMKVVNFLPETHEKVIMVPGTITVQMESDFDWDKIPVIFPEVLKNGKILKPDYNKDPSKMNPRERNQVIFDIFKSILTDPKHLEEVIKPLSVQKILDAKDALPVSLKTEIDYNDPMIELEMEERNKVGAAGKGLYSNVLAGRNVAELLKTMHIKPGYAPIIDGMVFNIIGQTREYQGNLNENGNPIFDGDYTDFNIASFLQAALDASKNPIQKDINDNIYTNPISGLMLSVGIPIDTITKFLAQPMIKEIVEIAKIKDIGLGNLKRAINAVVSKHKYTLKGEITSMNKDQLSEDLRNVEISNQLKYVENFHQFFLGGRALQTVYKLVTPDTMKNVTEFAAINAHLDTEDLYLRNEDSLIKGAEELITHNTGEDITLNPIGVAYRGILNTVIQGGNDIGFINNSNAVKGFKHKLKNLLNIHTFNIAQHKIIDRALFLKMMVMPHSPYTQPRGSRPALISEEAITRFYRNPKSNIITILERFKITNPKLNNNIFIQSLSADPSNAETGVYLLQVDIPFGASTNDKNNLSDSLLDLIKNPAKYANTAEDVANIRSLGQVLIGNQLLTHGFSPTFGSYIDLIPSETLTTDILNPGKGTPVEFFEQETQELFNEEYFNDFLHEFVRSYGTLKPGNKSFLPIIKRIPNVNSKGEVTFNTKDNRIWDDAAGSYHNYFLTYSARGPEIFVNTGANQYTRLNLLGKPRKINEIGIVTEGNKSLLNLAPDATTSEPRNFYSSKPSLKDDTDQNDDPLKICK